MEEENISGIPAAAPAPALQRRPLGYGLGACESVDMADKLHESILRLKRNYEFYGESKRVLFGEGNGGEPQWHGVSFETNSWVVEILLVYRIWEEGDANVIRLNYIKLGFDKNEARWCYKFCVLNWERKG